MPFENRNRNLFEPRVGAKLLFLRQHSNHLSIALELFARKYPFDLTGPYSAFHNYAESQYRITSDRLQCCSPSLPFGVLAGHFRTAIQLFTIPHNYEKRCKPRKLHHPVHHQLVHVWTPKISLHDSNGFKHNLYRSQIFQQILILQLDIVPSS